MSVGAAGPGERGPADLALSPDDQRQRLIAFLEYATNPAEGECNFGAMVIIERPGDVVFAAPIAPEMRGIEIVSPLKDNNYDIWKSGRPFEFNLSKGALLEWLRSQSSHTEAEFLKHAAQWAEEALKYYNVPRRH